MSINTDKPITPIDPQKPIGDGNDDLRQQRREILRESLMESNDAMYHNEKKKNIEALR